VHVYRLPGPKDLQRAGRDERMNIFRRYFASSRYNRLLIQQALVRSARAGGAPSGVEEMERLHNIEFVNTVERIKKYGYYEEFLDAVKEEDDALQKIIEAYDRRMTSR
jgi:hypothetical protein